MLELAERHLLEGRLDVAEKAATEIFAKDPTQAAALHLLGIIKWQRNEARDAIAFIEKALSLPGAKSIWHCNLTEMCRVAGWLDNALKHGKQGVKLNPDYADAWYNLGIVHFDRCEVDEAISCERRAVELNPHHAGAHFELGEALLLKGDYRAGWEEYEWRFSVAGAPPLLPAELANGRSWNGEKLHDKTLLVIADQGFGDVIQFMRYIPLVAKQCRDLVIACGVEMKPLVVQMVEKIPKPVRMFQVWKEAPAFDYYMALSSLPRFFGTEIDTIPAQVPYLRADTVRLEHWRRRLQSLTPANHRRIGLVWSGRTGPGNNPNRAIALNDLAPLGALNDVALLSLQKSDAGNQVGSYYGEAPLINLAPEIRDFLDTAAIIEHLDLVVTIDTSVAHLTGALGRPAAILLQFAADWRWQRNRNDSPWYPSVRLYRQTQPKDWAGVVQQLVQDLRDHPNILREGFIWR